MSDPVTPLAPDTAAAIELSKKLDRAMEEFAGEYGALLRKACGVPNEVTDLGQVVICTFLGHTLDRLSLSRGRDHVEDVVETVLDELARVRAASLSESQRKGPLQ